MIVCIRYRPSIRWKTDLAADNILIRSRLVTRRCHHTKILTISKEELPNSRPTLQTEHKNISIHFQIPTIFWNKAIIMITTTILKSTSRVLSLFLVGAGTNFMPVIMASAFTPFETNDELKTAVDQYCAGTFTSSSVYGWVVSGCCMKPSRPLEALLASRILFCSSFSTPTHLLIITISPLCSFLETIPN